MQIMEKMNYKDLQHGAERTIGHRSHRTFRSSAVRRVFIQGGKIVDCIIVYVIFLIVVIRRSKNIRA